MWESGEFLNRRWVGHYEQNFENGKPNQIFNYDLTGRRKGRQRYYFESGILARIENYVSDSQEGYTLEFNKNEQLMKAELFINGKKAEAGKENKEMLEQLLEIVRKENEIAKKNQ